MEAIIDILKFTIPALIVFGVTYFIIKSFFDKEQRAQMQEIKLASKKEYTPKRIQAYERSVLYLERIDLNNLIMRIHKPHMSAQALYSEVMKTIREEYYHNMVQQLYVSSKSWKQLKVAKEETVKIVNMAMNSMNDGASGLDLSKVVLEIVSKLEKIPTEVALEKINTDFQRIMQA